MPIDSKVIEEFNKIRSRCYSTKSALWLARVNARIVELRERNLFDALWDDDQDFSVETYLKDLDHLSKHDKRKMESEFKRNYWSVKFLMVYLGPDAPSSEISVDDMHATESLSWILLPESRRREEARLWDEMYYEAEVASGLKDFWTYDPDPLVMMANEANKKAWMR